MKILFRIPFTIYFLATKIIDGKRLLYIAKKRMSFDILNGWEEI